MTNSLSDEELLRITEGKYLLIEAAEDWYNEHQEGMSRADVSISAFIAGAQAMVAVITQMEQYRATESKLNEWHSTTKQ